MIQTPDEYEAALERKVARAEKAFAVVTMVGCGIIFAVFVAFQIAREYHIWVER